MVVRGMLAVLLTAVLWGTTGTAAAQTTAGPLAIGAVAMGVGGLLQAAVSGWWPHRARLRARPGVVAVGAVSVAVYPLAFYSSMHLAGVAVGTVVSIGSAPLIAAVLERRFTVRWGIGATLGVLGVALLSAGHGAVGGSAPGILLGLLAGLTYAVYSWAAATLMAGGIPSRAAMGAVFGLGGVLLVPVMIVTAPALLAAPHGPAVAAYLALVPMFGGYLLFGWGLARVPVSTAITLTLLEPAVAALLAVLVVGEHLGPLGWVGVGLVGGCLVVLTAPVPWRGDPVRRRLAAARRRA